MTEQTTSERIEVSRAIAAEPAAIFDVLRDPNGQVAIDASGMLMWASGAPAGAAGDSFVMHMDRDALRDVDLGEYEVTVTFVTYEQDREIAWTVGRNANEQFGHLYGYRLEPVAGGTLVTQYYDWSQISGPLKERFPIISEGTLRATLGILSRTVAPRASRPGASA
jgi:Polyketide cyclase / dehydrase and lipid transport